MTAEESATSGGLRGYTIAGGRADADRLARQARVMAGATASFLSHIGLRAGWACLDVGCGDGQVTLELARAAGPSGRAVGIDIDEGALALARRSAEEAGVGAEFVLTDATAPPEQGAFDLAYARLLLSHLAEPVAALRAMRSAVRADGVVAVEDLFTGVALGAAGTGTGSSAGGLQRDRARPRRRPDDRAAAPRALRRGRTRARP